MFVFDLDLISKFRKELMGVAAISIILCHAPANIPEMNPILAFLLKSLGMFGNPTFFFLSGVGMYFSLSRKKNAISIYSWYQKRFLRLFIPYLLIMIIVQAIFVTAGKVSICNALKYLIGVSYFTEGKGAWFLWALVPMYLLAPILKRIIEHKLLNIICLPLLCLLFLSMRLVDEKSFSSIQQICENFPVFILGMWTAKYISQKISINLLHPIFLFLLIFIIRLYFDLKIFPMVIFTVFPSIIIGCFLVYLFSSLKSLFTYFGDISLESYLFNVSLPGVLLCIPFLNSEINSLHRYILVIVIGVILSMPVHIFSKSLEKLLLNLSFKKE